MNARKNETLLAVRTGRMPVPVPSRTTFCSRDPKPLTLPDRNADLQAWAVLSLLRNTSGGCKQSNDPIHGCIAGFALKMLLKLSRY
jgi:hypothetical protein